VSRLNPVAPSEAQAELIIDLAALVANWRSLAARIAPAACAAVVKADAYGVGTEQASKALFEAGCRVFFVARRFWWRRTAIHCDRF
jgi:alanine racemase